MGIYLPQARKITSGPSGYNDFCKEYIVEVFTNHENNLPESKNKHQREIQPYGRLQLWQSVRETSAADPLVSECTNKFYLIYADKNAYQFIKEINPPPPKLNWPCTSIA